MKLNVAAAQTAPIPGAIQENTENIINYIQQARNRGIDLVVFPEMAVTGYNVGDLLENHVFLDAAEDAVTTIADATAGIAAVVGCPRQDNDDLYNAAAVIHDQDVQGYVYKTLLPTYRYFDDARYFTRGTPSPPFTLTLGGEEVKLGVLICEDIWTDRYEQNPVTTAAEDADLLTALNASPFTAGKRRSRVHTVQRHVNQEKIPFIYVNQAGVGDHGQDIVTYDGESLIYGKTGELAARGAAFQEDLATATLPLEGRVEHVLAFPARDWEAGVHKALTDGIQRYVEVAGFDRLVVPVSGGIDSATGLALCVDAVGADRVDAYTLPADATTDTSIRLADAVATNLGVTLHTVPVEDLAMHVLDTYEQEVAPVTDTVAEENVYARLRTVCLMLAANDEDALLVANANETELALGYATLYGDMTGAFAPLADIPKTEVYRLAEYINQCHDKTIIPGEVFERAPSAELSRGQEDPFDYDIVSPLIDLYVAERLDPSQVVDLFTDRGLPGTFPVSGVESVYDQYTEESFHRLAYNIYDRVQSNVFKRVQAPPVFIVSGRGFGNDLREVVLNRWRGGDPQ